MTTEIINKFGSSEAAYTAFVRYTLHDLGKIAFNAGGEKMRIYRAISRSGVESPSLLASYTDELTRSIGGIGVKSIGIITEMLNNLLKA